MTVELATDILIVGGGTGGVAAAMAATSLGKRVILTEETSWIGGQLTAQAVPPDEHRWIEQFGCTRRYRNFRNEVRDYYRRYYSLTATALRDPALNPGQGTVSRLCHEFPVALAILKAFLAAPQAAGLLQILLHTIPIAAEVDGDHVRAIHLRNRQTDEEYIITARYILDATELGDLLPMTGTEYVTGAESQNQTGEPHAVNGPPQPNNVQGFTWCFPVAYDPTPGANHVIDRPAQYERWRSYIPPLTPAWPGLLLDWIHPDPITSQPRKRTLFSESGQRHALWCYRRIIYQGHYLPAHQPHEVTLVNWPQNDYFEGNIIDKPMAERARYLEEARQLSLSLLYWLQTEAPRPDGRIGYPGLYLRPDLVGSSDGLAQYPYIRESRRIRAVYTVTELDVGAAARSIARGQPGLAEEFTDSVGIGCYRIDLHPSTGHNNYIDIDSLPFRIPLGALLPIRIRNLLPACKNLGVTHITNGCYRLHPVEWNIGEAAGLLASYCLISQTCPHDIREHAEKLHDFQQLCIAQGFELSWPQVHAV